MHFVYLIKSIDFPNQIYIGCTSDIKNRLKTHNQGGSPHTAKYKPWKLHAYFAFDEKHTSYQFEKYLKSHAGKAFAKKRFLQI